MFTMSSTSGSRPQTASDFKPTQYPIGSLQGLAMVKANANLDHFLALLILVCMTIAMYLAMEEISHAMGEGALTRLFFKRPDTA